MKNTILIILLVFIHSSVKTQIFEDFTALQCDSLIKANEDNPNFVILDIRTANEHNSQHLEGAIMRNYYDSDFQAQLDMLNKDKTYLVHCRSGGRSGAAMPFFMDLGFQVVYNMKNGINDWNANGLPTTTEFAPKLSFISDTVFVVEPIVGESYNYSIVLTNRANDVLRLLSFQNAYTDEIQTDFGDEVELLGSEDYTFNIVFTPLTARADTLVFAVETNAGIKDIMLILEYNSSTEIVDYNRGTRIFPNPASRWLNIESVDNINSFEMFDIKGELVYKNHDIMSSQFDISNLRSGFYIAIISYVGYTERVRIFIK